MGEATKAESLIRQMERYPRSGASQTAAAKLRTVIAEAEGYIAQLRVPLLYHFGTTDPELLVEAWERLTSENPANHGNGTAPAVQPSAPCLESPDEGVGLPDSQELGEFHWRDGLLFRRLPSGHVRIRRGQVLIAEIPAAEWDSVVREVAGSAAPEGERTVQVFNVADFGASPDASGEVNAVAFQRACDAATAAQRDGADPPGQEPQ